MPKYTGNNIVTCSSIAAMKPRRFESRLSPSQIFQFSTIASIEDDIDSSTPTRLVFYFIFYFGYR